MWTQLRNYIHKEHTETMLSKQTQNLFKWIITIRQHLPEFQCGEHLLIYKHIADIQTYAGFTLKTAGQNVFCKSSEILPTVVEALKYSCFAKQTNFCHPRSLMPFPSSTWVCWPPITLQGWHCYLSDRLSCSKTIYLPASAPSRIQVIGGGLRGRCRGGGAHWDLLCSWRQIKIHHRQGEDT